VPDQHARGELFVNGEHERFVAFFIGPSLFGVPASEVAEVAHPVTVTPLPNAPSSLHGIAPLRGEVLAVVDLSGLVGETSESAMPRPKFVVLNARSDGDTQIAFPVDRMHEIVSLAPAAVTPAELGSGVLRGTGTGSFGKLSIIDTAVVAATLEIP
jgi:chemotaxis signal transduction protein